MKINFYKYEILFVTLVILFGLILRGYNINLNDFWSDEMASFYLSNPNLNFLEILIVVASSSNIACFGSINGTINLTIIGGGGYTFIWTGPPGFVDPGTQNLTGLDPGNYSVFVTDINGCSSAQNIVVDGGISL